jgi:thiamine-phosphate pyrophosphorylase
MSDAQINRIIDVNLNRVGEGLRVLEEAARFVLDDKALSAHFKKMRHKVALRDMQAKLTYLSARDAVCDIGENIKTSFQSSPRGLLEVATANARRAAESLRVLEELAQSAKLDSQVYATVRYQLYTLEKELFGRLSRYNKAHRICGLYAVIDTKLLKEHNILEVTSQILADGAKIIQLCDKCTLKSDLLQLACKIKELCTMHEALFIINEHLDIVLASNADGLHVGQSDLPVVEMRHLLPIDRVIGRTINTLDEALQAQRAGADYISYGAVFSTLTQSECPTVEPEVIKSIKQAVQLPLVLSADNNLHNIANIPKIKVYATDGCSAIILAPLKYVSLCV